jgi:PST family polysaccharide transporter
VPAADEQQAVEARRGLAGIVVRGAGLAAMGFALSRLLTFAAYLVLARLAAPDVFGEYTAGAVLIGLGGVFVESGLAAALIQRPDRVEEAANSAFLAIVLAGCAFAGVAAAGAPLVGLVFDSHRVGLVALALSGLLVVGSFKAIPDALMQRRFSFLRRVVVDPLGAAAFGIAAIVALAHGLGVWGLVVAAYAAEVTQAASSWYLSRWRPNLRLASVEIWRELAGYGRYLLAANIVDHLVFGANAVLLGRFVSQSALGQYRYAVRFGALPHEVTVNVASYVLMPAFSRLAPESKRFAAALRRSLRWTVALVLPLSSLFVPLGVPVAVLLLGERWRPAGTAMMILSAWSAAHAAGSLASAALKGAGRPRIVTGLHLLHGSLAIALMVAFVPLGLNGIAAAATLAAVVADGVAVAAAVRVAGTDVRAVVTDLTPPLLAAGAMIGALFAVDRLAVDAAGHATAPGVVLLAAEAAFGLGLYALVLLVLSGPIRRDSSAVLRRRLARPVREP